MEVASARWPIFERTSLSEMVAAPTEENRLRVYLEADVSAEFEVLN